VRATPIEIEFKEDPITGEFDCKRWVPPPLEPALIGMMRGDMPEAYLFWGNDVSWFIQIHCARSVVDKVEAGLRALAGA